MFLILDADHFDVRKMLSGKIPDGAIIARVDGSSRQACVQAMMLLSGKALPAGAPNGGWKQILIVDPEDPANIKSTKLYAARWLDQAGYAYRVPCSDWPVCENPAGPVTAYYRRPGTGPSDAESALCRYCRLARGPSEAARAKIAANNRSRKKLV